MTRDEFLQRKRALPARYPYQFCNLPGYMYSIEPGWMAVFERLCHAIDSVLTDDEKNLFFWLQIKEKFGALRTYWSQGPIHVDLMPIEPGQGPATILCARKDDRDELIQSLEAKVTPLIQAAGEAAASMCSICAEPGALRTDRSWWLTLCDTHAIVPSRELRVWPEDQEETP